MKASRIISALASLICCVAASSDGWALCTINAASITVTPLTASTGTYTAPTAPTSQNLTITVAGTYNSTASGNTCTVGLSFQRPSLPATMLITGGGTATLPYSITTAASGGGSSLLFTGGTVFLSNIAQISFAGANNQTNRSFSVNFSIFFLMQPGTAQAGGSYSDSLTAWTFDIVNLVALTSRPFTVTGIVTKTCTIGGVARPTADSATIPVSVAGAVNTAVINKSYASVACNTPSNVQITSQSGAVKNSGTPPSGFTNLINYAASATFSGATATLNTASTSTAIGPESGTAVSTTGATPSGTMTVSITPQANALRLLSGAYSDVMTITITPQ